MNSQGISLCSTYQRLGTEKSQQSGNAKKKEREKERAAAHGLVKSQTRDSN